MNKPENLVRIELVSAEILIRFSTVCTNSKSSNIIQRLADFHWINWFVSVSFFAVVNPLKHHSSSLQKDNRIQHILSVRCFFSFFYKCNFSFKEQKKRVEHCTHTQSYIKFIWKYINSVESIVFSIDLMFVYLHRIRIRQSIRIGVAFHEKWKWWIKKEKKVKQQSCCCFSFPIVRFSIMREH